MNFIGLEGRIKSVNMQVQRSMAIEFEVGHSHIAEGWRGIGTSQHTSKATAAAPS